MDINTIYLNIIKLGDYDGEIETMNHVRLVAWYNEQNRFKAFKKERKQKYNVCSMEFNQIGACQKMSKMN